MSSRAMSLKGKIKNIAKSKNISAQVVLQNYLFECFLERLAMSNYEDKFVLKGGMLIAAIVGLDNRATMDLDTTIRNFQLNTDNVVMALTDICNITLDDDIKFSLKRTEPIRKDDIYGGIRVGIEATYDTIVAPMSIDVSTGDAITPMPVRYKFSGMFDEKKEIELWAYNIETILAEKAETILRRGALNTRPRDYYDIYILCTTQAHDKSVFKEAFWATATHRGSGDLITDTTAILQSISESDMQRNMWTKYCKEFAYAKDISFDHVLSVISDLVKNIGKNAKL